jgi:S-adenosylmethionine:tRNA ribosyltransferase-isomerase
MARDGSLTSDYDFELPADRIAQTAVEPRDASRLMVVHRDSGAIEHRYFRDLVTLIPPGDVLAVNRTRVLRARLLGTRDSGAPAEVLLLKPTGNTPGEYEAMVSPGGKLKPGRLVHIAPELAVRIVSITDRRTRIVQLETALAFEDAVERYGAIPLPPYIERAATEADANRYQTVYAREAGSVAAPTAGLHFTPELLAALDSHGVERAEVVLHVGAGTFKPVEVDDPTEHVMHEEWYDVPRDAADRVNAAHERGAAVWAVGTTSVRTLESAADGRGRVAVGASDTRLFIRPGYTFQAVDHIVTNFHLPRSTLLMLVAAFAGYELMMHAYETAVAEGYRFYSYGDAMLLI